MRNIFSDYKKDLPDFLSGLVEITKHDALRFAMSINEESDLSDTKKLRESLDRSFRIYVEVIAEKILRCLEKPTGLLLHKEPDLKTVFVVPVNFRTNQKDLILVFSEQLALECPFIICSIRMKDAFKTPAGTEIELAIYR